MKNTISLEQVKTFYFVFLVSFNYLSQIDLNVYFPGVYNTERLGNVFEADMQKILSALLFI